MVSFFSDGEAIVLEFWGMWSTPSLTMLADLISLRLTVPFRVPSVRQIDLLKKNSYLR